MAPAKPGRKSEEVQVAARRPFQRALDAGKTAPSPGGGKGGRGKGAARSPSPPQPEVQEVPETPETSISEKKAGIKESRLSGGGGKRAAGAAGGGGGGKKQRTERSAADGHDSSGDDFEESPPVAKKAARASPGKKSSKKSPNNKGSTKGGSGGKRGRPHKEQEPATTQDSASSSDEQEHKGSGGGAKRAAGAARGGSAKKPRVEPGREHNSDSGSEEEPRVNRKEPGSGRGSAPRPAEGQKAGKQAREPECDSSSDSDDFEDPPSSAGRKAGSVGKGRGGKAAGDGVKADKKKRPASASKASPKGSGKKESKTPLGKTREISSQASQLSQGAASPTKHLSFSKAGDAPESDILALFKNLAEDKKKEDEDRALREAAEASQVSMPAESKKPKKAVKDDDGSDDDDSADESKAGRMKRKKEETADWMLPYEDKNGANCLMIFDKTKKFFKQCLKKKGMQNVDALAQAIKGAHQDPISLFLAEKQLGYKEFLSESEKQKIEKAAAEFFNRHRRKSRS